MRGFSFLYQFATNPKTVGAIMPSSKFLATKMVEQISFDKAKYIVEYGPGTGIFTEKIIQHKRPDTILLIIEFNRDFYLDLKNKYAHEKNVHIVHGSAENINEYLRTFNMPYADYIVSGLPFTSLDKIVSSAILKRTVLALHKEGKFVTFQYSKAKQVLFNDFFSIFSIKKEYRNLPPAYVFTCSKKRIK